MPRGGSVYDVVDQLGHTVGVARRFPETELPLVAIISGEQGLARSEEHWVDQEVVSINQVGVG